MVLERGEVANSWRRERWDSLRLLTPNWQSRLPGYRYEGAHPDGFMDVAEVVAFISRFAAVAAAPVRTHTAVTSVRKTDEGYHVATGNGDLRCRCLVLASGACNLPHVPSLRQAVPSSIVCVTPTEYRNPEQLPSGGVLVVGASALLDRYGTAVRYIEDDGFDIVARVYMVLEGENLVTSAKSTGIGLSELATVFDNLKPDAVVTVADRYETLATAVAAAYMNIPLVHVQGGEVTGSIDEKVRHAVTKLSNLHLVSTKLADRKSVV